MYYIHDGRNNEFLQMPETDTESIKVDLIVCIDGHVWRNRDRKYL